MIDEAFLTKFMLDLVNIKFGNVFSPLVGTMCKLQTKMKIYFAM